MSHLSLDQLGDVDAVADHPHLAHCPDCRAVRDEQLAVRELLGSLPDPGAAPPDVVVAIEAALRDAAPPARAAGTAGAAPLLGAVRPLRDARELAPPGRGRRIASGAGKLLLGVAAAGLVVTGLSRLSTGGSGSSSAGTSGAGSSASAGGSASSGTDGGGPVTPATGRGPGAVVLRSGTGYTGADLVAQVRAQLGAGRPPELAPAAARLLAAAAAAGGPSDLSGCLRAVGARGTPIAVDVATFDRTPAAVVVVRDGSRSTIWVVPRSCGPGRGTRLATAPLP